MSWSQRIQGRSPGPAPMVVTVAPVWSMALLLGSAATLDRVVVIGCLALQTPALSIALVQDLVRAPHLGIDLLLHAERATDLVDDILIGRGHTAPDRFLARGFGAQRVGIDIA